MKQEQNGRRQILVSVRFRNEVLHFCQEIYYPLIAIYKTEYNLVKRLEKYGVRNFDYWRVTISNAIFRPQYKNKNNEIYIPIGILEFAILGSRLLYVAKRNLNEREIDLLDTFVDNIEWDKVLSRQS